MNIFYLDKDPNIAATMLCDIHISKMIIESAQLLSTAHNVLDGESESFYRTTHINHPCAKWVRESKHNYMWLWRHMRGLCEEYTRRYKNRHKSSVMLVPLSNPPKNIPSTGPTKPALAMPDQYKRECPVQSYRNYYQEAKYDIAYWRHSPKPYWWRN